MKAGLLLVDIQKDYFPGGKMELVAMEQAAQKARELLSRFREKRWPLFHVRHLSATPEAPFFVPGTDGADIHASVAPLPGEIVVQKHYPNSFRETPLRDHVAAAGIRQLVICGAMSHMCIDATTRAAFDLGFDCTVVEDACATRQLEYHGRVVAAHDVQAAFMAALAAAYATVVPAATVLSGE